MIGAFIVRHYSALGEALYRRYWLGSISAVGGGRLVTLAQAWLVYELSGSALALGYLGAATAIPSIFITMYGGALADRFDRRFLIMVSSLSTASLFLVLGLLDLLEIVKVWHVIVIAAMTSAISGIDGPARQAFFPALISREQLMSAVALNSIIWQSTRMILPAIGGVLIAVTDTWVNFFLGMMGYLGLFAVMATLRVRVPRPEMLGSSLQHVVEGVRFILDTRLFLVLIMWSYIGMFFANSYGELMPAFARMLEASERGYGLLISMGGVGSVVGTLIVGTLQSARRLGWIMLGGAAVSALMLYGFCLVSGLADVVPGAFYGALVFVFAAAMFGQGFMISSMTVMQMNVPDALRGRVMGIHSITYSFMSLGALLLGAIADATSPPVAVGIGVSVYLFTVLTIAITQPIIRSIDGGELEATRAA
jgi:MFS family permease